MSNLIVISALGKDRPGIVNELSKAILDAGGNIEDSRMLVLGGEFALMILVSGEEPTIVKIEWLLPQLQNSFGLTVIAKRTQPRTVTGPSMPYVVEVIAMDHPGIVHEISRFFSDRKINVEEMDTSSYAAPHTGTRMFSLDMVVSIPATLSIPQLRDDFADFCDALNVDAVLEPKK
jgi:glycine cleavage system transcriptional repressor